MNRSSQRKQVHSHALRDDQKRALEREAQLRNVSQSEVVRRAIDAFLGLGAERQSGVQPEAVHV